MIKEYKRPTKSLLKLHLTLDHNLRSTTTFSSLKTLLFYYSTLSKMVSLTPDTSAHPGKAPLVTLSSGYKIPVTGFGVYKTSPDDCINAVYCALKTGYRHIDSAKRYANEKECGIAIRKWMEETGAKREEVFFTTKLWDEDQGYESTKEHIKGSVERSGLGYIDLYLVHSPNPGPEKRLESYKAMQEAVDAGLVRSIGVSNYGIAHLKQLMAWEGYKIKPVINQLELHPWLARKDIVDFCRDNGIALEAFCPVFRGQKFDDPDLVKLSEKYNKTPAQVLVRWSIDKGFIPLVKSVTPSRIAENIDVFDFKLSPEDVDLLETDQYLHLAWDPVNVD